MIKSIEYLRPAPFVAPGSVLPAGPIGKQGPQGVQGNPGIQGDMGYRGWSPILAGVNDGSRRVLQVVDWAGGEGTKPAAGSYIGPTGLVGTAAAAVDIRGIQGIQGIQGDPGEYTPSILPNGNFKYDLDHWPNRSFPAGGGVSIDTTTASSGTKSLLLDKGAAGATASSAQAIGDLFPVTPGQAYNVVAFMKADVANAYAILAFYWFKADGSASSIPVSYITGSASTSGLLPVSGLLAAPADAAQAQCGLYHDYTSVARKLWIDDVKLVQIASPAQVGLVEPVNLIKNPNFEVNGFGSAETWAPDPGSSVVATGAGSALGKYCLTSSSVDTLGLSRKFPVRPGGQILVEFMYNTTRSGDAAIWCVIYDKTGTILTNYTLAATGASVKGADALYTGRSAVLPAGSYEAQLYPYSTPNGGLPFSIGRFKAIQTIPLAGLADAAAASLVGATAAGAHVDLTGTQARGVLGLATTDVPVFAGVGAYAAGVGSIGLRCGDSSHSGYLEIFNGAGQRRGYLGFDNSNVLLNLENASTFYTMGGKAGVGLVPSFAQFVVSGGAAVSAAAPRIDFIPANQAGSFGYLSHDGAGGGLNLINTQSANLVFGTNNTSRAQFDASGHFLPLVTSAYNLGSAALYWANLYASNLYVDANFKLGLSGSNPIITFDSGDDCYYDRSANAWVHRIGGVGIDVLSASAYYPGSNNAVDIGISAYQWRHAFFAGTVKLGNYSGGGLPAAGTAGRIAYRTDGFLVLDNGTAWNVVGGGTTGSIVDRAYAEYTAATAITTKIPNDDTIPQNTEGTQILTASITPKSTTNRVRVRAIVCGWGGSAVAVALFRNSTANALRTAQSTWNAYGCTVLEFEDSPGSTSTQTYNIRVGSSAANCTPNGGGSGARWYGGSAACTLVLEEIAA